MADCKGAALVFLRSKIKKAGAENLIHELLSEEDRKTWENTLSFHWFPIEMLARFWAYCSKVLYPHKSQDEAAYVLGLEEAKEDIKTLYRFVFKIISIEAILKKSASLWQAHHTAGNSHVEQISSRQFRFSVMDYPTFPKEICLSTAGYIHGLLEIAGQKNISVKVNKKDTGVIWDITLK